MLSPSLQNGTGVFLSTNDRSRTMPSLLAGQHALPSRPHFGGSGRQRGVPRRVSPGEAQNALSPHCSWAPEQPSRFAAPPQGRQSLPQSAVVSFLQVPMTLVSLVRETSLLSFLNMS
jgi:hypothetical protein